MTESAGQLSVTAEPGGLATTRANRTLLYRIAVRITFVYLLLYTYFGLVIVPFAGDWLARPVDRAWRFITPWFAVHVFGLSGPVTQYHPTGSGDTTLDYVRVCCYVVLAAAGALLWSILDRGERRSQILYPWVRLVVRFYLGAILLSYGFSKVFPLQFPTPDFTRLSETFGEASPMGLLWAFMGASTPYQMFSGMAEVIPGLLLLFRRTATLGALLALAVMSNVVALNFCFDVPVKLFSAHLWLMALFLLIADGVALWKFLILRRSAQLPGVWIPRFERRALRTTAIVLQILVIGGVLYGTFAPKYTSYRENGTARTRASALSGVWESDNRANYVSSYPQSGESEVEWRRLYVPLLGRLSARTPTGKLLRFISAADEKAHTLHLKGWRNNHSAEFSYVQGERDHLVLTGSIDRQHVELHYHRVDPGQFPLTTRGFHWVQEDPYNL